MISDVYLCHECLNIFVPRKEVNSFKVISSSNDFAHFCGQECLDKFVKEKKDQRAARERMDKEHEELHAAMQSAMMGRPEGRA